VVGGRGRRPPRSRRSSQSSGSQSGVGSGAALLEGDEQGVGGGVEAVGGSHAEIDVRARDAEDRG
jgi:hypothetical protein